MGKVAFADKVKAKSHLEKGNINIVPWG